MQCFYHVDAPSVATCTNGCGKTLCRSCAEVYKKAICADCAEEMHLAQESINKQEHSEYMSIMASAVKALKFYAISTLVFIAYFSYVYYVYPPGLFVHSVFLGFVFSAIVSFKDRRYYEAGVFKRVQMIFAFTLLGPILLSFLSLIGWSRIAIDISKSNT